MLRSFSSEFFEYKDGVLICDDEIINIQDIKAVIIENVGNAVHTDANQNIFLVRIKMKDGTLIRILRTNTQHCAVETLKKLSEILQKHGDFAQYGGCIINMELVDRALLSIDDNTKVSAVFKDNDTIIIVNTPFPRVAKKCHSNLKRDIIKYKVKHRVVG